jgi:hypothetical protein
MEYLDLKAIDFQVSAEGGSKLKFSITFKYIDVDGPVTTKLSLTSNADADLPAEGAPSWLVTATEGSAILTKERDSVLPDPKGDSGSDSEASGDTIRPEPR